ncbi:MAG: oxygenase MpaB family protein [Myxococcota bacterium]
MRLSPPDFARLQSRVSEDPQARVNARRTLRSAGIPRSPDGIQRAIQVEGLFPVGGPTRANYRRPTSLALLGSTLLLEVAPITIAEPLARNGGFLGSPFARVRHTYRSGAERVWGDWERVFHDAALLRRVHERIGGAAIEVAENRWVWAAMARSLLLNNALFMGADAQCPDALYTEFTRVAGLVGLTSDQLPKDAASFERFIDHAASWVRLSSDSVALAEAILSVLADVVEEQLGSRPPGLEDQLRTITAGALPKWLLRAYNARLSEPLPTVGPEQLAMECRAFDRFIGAQESKAALSARQRIAEAFPPAIQAHFVGAHWAMSV